MTDREAFEAWFRPRFEINLHNDGDRYFDERARLMFDAWQEAMRMEREACATLCQETPQLYYDAGGSLLPNTPQRLSAAIRARSRVEGAE
jgi:hypothetical protein